MKQLQTSLCALISVPVLRWLVDSMLWTACALRLSDLFVFSNQCTVP